MRLQGSAFNHRERVRIRRLGTLWVWGCSLAGFTGALRAQSETCIPDITEAECWRINRCGGTCLLKWKICGPYSQVIEGAIDRPCPTNGCGGAAPRDVKTPAKAPSSPAKQPSAHGKKTLTARGTGYYPDPSELEGGFADRKGNPLHTLQDYLAGKAPFVSVAMDTKAFPYGTELQIDELDAQYNQHIPFRVVDTGDAFKGQGTGRMDICVANQRASLDPVINGTLHYHVVP